MENPNYYAVIPANVRYANIKANAKLLYGEITALANKTGLCWASNSYFANLYSVSEKQVSLWIKELAEAGFITVYVNPKEGNKRYIGIHQKVMTSLPKGNHPIHQKVIHNNTRNNNTINKKKKTSKKFDADSYIESLELGEEYTEAILGWLEIRKAKKVATTQRSIDQNLAKLEKLKPEDRIKCLNESTANGWQGLFPEKFESVSTTSGNNGTTYNSRVPKKVIYAATEEEYEAEVRFRCNNYGSEPHEFKWVRQSKKISKEQLAKNFELMKKAANIGKI